VLTLEEAVAILRGRVQLNLEIKGEDAPGRLEIQCVGIVRSLRFFADTCFSSFSPARMHLVRDLADDARIGVLMDNGMPWSAGFALAEALGAEAVHPERRIVTADSVAEAHRRGLEVRVWPVNRPAEMEMLADAGVDGIFTDFPERLLRFGARGGAFP
jgi:glycerophosphoryl diester phosphodiesterase